MVESPAIVYRQSNSTNEENGGRLDCPTTVLEWPAAESNLVVTRDATRLRPLVRDLWAWALA